jgi:YtkA-like
MNRLLLVAALALAALLTAPAASLGGGWATVGLSSVPEGVKAGQAWVVDLTILQHGRTPLEGVKPKVMLERGIGDPDPAVFAARATDEPGVYRARVVFPSAGTWDFKVDDDFSQVHDFGTVKVGSGGEAVAAVAASSTARPPADSDGGGMSLLGALGIAVAAGLLAALVAEALRRRGEPRPAEG